MYQMPKLLKAEGLLHGFSTKDEGNMSFKWGDALSVLVNRQRFLDKLGVRSGNCVALKSPHTNRLVTITARDKGRGTDSIVTSISTDGFLTNTSGVMLCILVADSVPLILWDSQTRALALLHADWRCVGEHLASKAVRSMQHQFGSDPANICAYFGPSITAKSHILKDPIQKRDRPWQKYLTNLSNGTTAIDIVAYNRQQLRDAGIAKNHIIVSGIDTATDKRFFSHYRSQRTREKEGRFACVVGIK
jgi:YfiH family protein